MDDWKVLDEVSTEVVLEHIDGWQYKLIADKDTITILYREEDNTKESFEIPVFCADQIADVMKRLAAQYSE